ncbi:two-component sensor histidine kinase [Bifidobacterium aemilianum]|uniref:Two-component sensor histidine kinase n=1 Tax=Bifidobacterium aemilianum TaxID=2493120 RepID=A0A366K765_9BIFI|nr:histidine kinase [Bifidobacterium aemilianum]RBP97504.1 two-component sensor histidine kinase [Bifidobacterium aemilianum]
MGRIASWVGLLAIGGICGAWAFGGFTEVLASSLLAAVAAGALSEWLLPAPGALWTGALVALGAIFVPTWMVVLPALAFEAGVGLGILATNRRTIHDSLASGTWMGSSRDTVATRLGRGTFASARSWLALVLLPAFAWLIPALSALIRYDGPWQRYALLSLLAAALAQLAGMTYARLALAEQHIWQVTDVERYRVRQLRSRISDLNEELDRATHTARLSERTRIAREIHDNVGHQLTRAIMQTQAARVLAQGKGDKDTERSFADVGQTLDTAMTTIRRSVHDLEDDGTDFAAQMLEACQGVAMADSDDVVGQLGVDLNNGILTAPAPVARCFAAIIRESLNNTARHSLARSAHVTLRDLPAFWQLVVQDDGRVQQSRATGEDAGMGKPDRPHGLPSGERPPQGVELWRGMGLANIESRARALGGTANSGPNEHGWRVFVSLPKEPWTNEDHNGYEVHEEAAL